MAGYTPVSEEHLPMYSDDSGCFSFTPDSFTSLDSKQCSNKKQSHEYNCRNYASSTPYTPLYDTPEHCHGARRSLCHKRKTSLGRFNLLERSASLSSNVQLNKSSSTNSHLQRKGELLLQNDFVGLSVADSSFNLQENCKLEDSAIWCDEASVNENEPRKTKANDEVVNKEQISNKDKQAECCHQTYMPTAHATCMQDGKIGSQQTVTDHHLHHRSLPTEEYNLIPSNCTKLNSRSLSQDPLKRYQTPDFTHRSIPISLPYSSQQLLRLNAQEKVDFLSILGEKNDYSIIVKAILSYLEPVDLTAVTLVSKTWNRVCMSDSDASRRIHCYVEHKQRNKENDGTLEVNKLNSSTPVHHHPRIHLRQIQNMGHEGNSRTVQNPSSPPPSPGKRRFLQFYKAGQQLEDGKTLAPCPRCSLPSQIDRVSKVGQCTHKTCQYLFCCICRCESHNGSACHFLVSFPQSRKRPGSVCSKKSKKNLRRLSSTFT